MSTREPAAMIFAAGRLHTPTCAITEPNGVPVEQISDETLAAAKRCRTCNPSSRRVDALIAGAALRVAKPEQLAPALRPNAGDVGATIERAIGRVVAQSSTVRRARIVAVPSMLQPLRDAQTAAPVGELYAGERTCTDCGASKPITTFPTSTSGGVKIRLGYCRACRTVRAAAKTAS